MTLSADARITVEFLRMAAAGDVGEAFARHVANDFRHHNPWFALDRKSLLEAMEQSAAAEPNKSFEVQQVVAADGKVMVFSRLVRETGEVYAVVHIARLVDGKLVEMWDVAQPVPADSPNTLGMF